MCSLKGCLYELKWCVNGLCFVSSLGFFIFGYLLITWAEDVKTINEILDSATPTECELATFASWNCTTNSTHMKPIHGIAFAATAFVEICSMEENTTIPWTGELLGDTWENCFHEYTAWDRDIPFSQDVITNFTHGMKIDCRVNCDKGVFYTDVKITDWLSTKPWLGPIMFAIPPFYCIFCCIMEARGWKDCGFVIDPLLALWDILAMILFLVIAMPFILIFKLIGYCLLGSWPDEPNLKRYYCSSDNICRICSSEESDFELNVYDSSVSWNATQERLCRAIQGKWIYSDGLEVTVKHDRVVFEDSGNAYDLEPRGGRAGKPCICLKTRKEEWVLIEPDGLEISKDSTNITWTNNQSTIEWYRYGTSSKLDPWNKSHRKLLHSMQGDWKNADDLLISVSSSIVTFYPSSNEYKLYPWGFMEEPATLAMKIQHERWIMEVGNNITQKVSWKCGWEQIEWYRRQHDIELPPAYDECENIANPTPYANAPSSGTYVNEAPPTYVDNAYFASAPPLYKSPSSV